MENLGLHSIIVAPFQKTQLWFKDLTNLAEKIIVLDKDREIFMPINKANRDFAASTKWKVMILLINNKSPTKWYYLKLKDLFNKNVQKILGKN